MAGSVVNRKEQIVDLAADLLRIKGFEGFSYQDLANTLGIRKASIHHHFAKKEDLGLALCDWTRDWLVEGLEHFDAKGVDAWDRLARYVRGATKHMMNGEKRCPLSSLHGDLPLLPASMQMRIKELDNIELDWVTDVIQKGQASGEFSRKLDAQAMALSFIFTCKGALYYAWLHGEQAQNDLLQRTEKQLHTLLVGE